MFELTSVVIIKELKNLNQSCYDYLNINMIPISFNGSKEMVNEIKKETDIESVGLIYFVKFNNEYRA